MDYKREVKDNYTLHLIKTDRFKRVNVSFRFTKKYDREESAYLKLLSSVLPFNGTKKYKTRMDISRVLESLYNTGLSNSLYLVSRNMVYNVNLCMVNPKYTEENLYSDAFSVLKEIMFNPIIKSNKFKEEVFEIEKRNLIESIRNVKDEPSEYGRLKFEESFYKGTIYGENNYKNIKIYENLENEKLYQVYKRLFSEFKIDVLVIGDFDEDKIKSEVSKLLKDFRQSEDYVKGEDLIVKVKNQEVNNKMESVSTQSNLFVGVTMGKLTYEERKFVLPLYNAILGHMNNSILFVNVREKHSLCYYIGSVASMYTDTIVINAGINKKNYEKTLKLIKESLDSMSKKNVIKPLIVNAKKTLEIAYNDYYDNIFKIINHYYLNELSYVPTVEERREYLEKISVEDICEFAKKIEIKNIFLLEGTINEEN